MSRALTSAKTLASCQRVLGVGSITLDSLIATHYNPCSAPVKIGYGMPTRFPLACAIHNLQSAIGLFTILDSSRRQPHGRESIAARFNRNGRFALFVGQFQKLAGEFL